jgi:hypothetical protein
MKKITFIIALLVSAFQGSAQIASGSVAPNFTATDINGNVHTLSTYLAAGKTVIIDVSATWCAPCWNYHGTKALADFYNAYGPNGSNEVVVLFVEGDASTTLSDLNGTGNNTQGDWVSESPYPIIDGSNIGSLYQITYFPTVFRICPNGIVSEIGTLSATSLKNSINASCGVTLTGAQNHLLAMDTETSFCTATGSPIAKVKNYGANAVTTATVNLKENGVVVGTKASTGSFSQFATKTITFDPITINPASDYTVEIVSVNSGTNFNPALSVADSNLGVATYSAANVVVKVYTDNYPTEMSWAIKNSAGTTVASGGPYAGSANGGGIDANTTKTQNVTLNLNDCYTVQLSDSYGDGWSYGSTPHGLEIFSAANVSLYNLPAANFGTALVKSNVLTTTVLGVASNDVNKFSVFPNPTSGIVQINTEETVAVSIVDVTGKIVYNSNTVTKLTSIDLTGLQKGIYIAKIIGDKTITTEKIILK